MNENKPFWAVYVNENKPFWTLVSICVDTQKEMFKFYKDGFKTGPIREVRMHCMDEYNRFKEWGF